MFSLSVRFAAILLILVKYIHVKHKLNDKGPSTKIKKIIDKSKINIITEVTKITKKMH